MKKKDVMKVFLNVCLILTLVTLPAVVLAEKSNLPEIKIKFNALWPATGLLNEYITMPQVRLIEEAVPRAKCTVYYSLVPFQKSLEAVQKGLCDFSVVVSAMTPGAHPIHEVVELPFLWPKQAVSNAILLELHRRYPFFVNDFGPEVKHVASDVTLGIDIHTKDKPIRHLEDLRGMVFGCMTKSEAEALRKVGASALLVTPGDTYTPLERGTFKGICTAWGNIQSWRIYEITKYHTIVGITRTTMHSLFNRRTWNKFTPDEQKKLEWIFRYSFPQSHNLSGALSTIDVVDNYLLKDKNKHEIIMFPDDELAKWKEEVRPMWDKWADEMEAKGYPGKEVIAFIERFGRSLSQER